MRRLAAAVVVAIPAVVAARAFLVRDQLLFQAMGPCHEPGADRALDAASGDEVEPRFAASRLLLATR